MATKKVQYEVLEGFSLKAGDDEFEVGAVVELTPAQAKKFAENVKEVEEKLSPKKSDDNTGNDDDDNDRLKAPIDDVKVPGEPEDYLRQYQFKNVNNVPTIGGVKTDPTPGSKAETMKAHLLKQDKVRMFVPRNAGEDASILQSVNLNGYRLDFPKQTYIEVPRQVAEVLMESLSQTEKALNQNLISNLKDKGKDENALI